MLKSSVETDTKICIGAMSGTSLDGVDASAFAIAPLAGSGLAFELLSHVYIPFGDDLRAQLAQVCQGAAVSAGGLALLDHRVGLAYAQAIEQALLVAKIDSSQVYVVGAHGQTVHHQPAGEHRYTIQIGDANLMAVLTGIPVVADFRRRDMALGGQGAPLAPCFHQLVLRDPVRCRMVVNLGGIANLTVLIPGQATWGYDTGPANILLDAWIEHHQQRRFDEDGAWAQTGQVNPGLLTAMLSGPYFQLSHPKSTGRELFNMDWLHRHIAAAAGHLPSEDVQRTLLELTVLSVADAVRRSYAHGGDVIVCGGGAKNKFLMARLAQVLSNWTVMASDAVGIPSQSMETLAFATFAWRTMQGQPSSEPSVTGARRACVLGNVYVC
jgi:anhydro-N-acetylmuramic acid kinase